MPRPWDMEATFTRRALRPPSPLSAAGPGWKSASGVLVTSRPAALSAAPTWRENASLSAATVTDAPRSSPASPPERADRPGRDALATYSTGCSPPRSARRHEHAGARRDPHRVGVDGGGQLVGRDREADQVVRASGRSARCRPDRRRSSPGAARGDAVGPWAVADDGGASERRQAAEPLPLEHHVRPDAVGDRARPAAARWCRPSGRSAGGRSGHGSSAGGSSSPCGPPRCRSSRPARPARRSPAPAARRRAWGGRAHPGGCACPRGTSARNRRGRGSPARSPACPRRRRRDAPGTRRASPRTRRRAGWRRSRAWRRSRPAAASRRP